MAQIKTQINAILEKKMERKDFLKHVAVGMVALSGAGAALRLLSSKQQQSKAGGYGSSAYGGVESPR